MTSPETTSPRPTSPGPTDPEAVTGRKDYSIPLSVRQLLPGLVLVFLAVRVLGPVADPDTLWHVRAGRDILTTGDFVGPDPWGGLGTHEWIRHQWLGEVILALADMAAGLTGVVFLGPLAMVALIGAVMWSTRAAAALLPSTIVAGVAVLTTFGSFSLRPQLLSFVLAALFAGAWWRSTRDLRARWWLIPLTWVWAGAHGFWVVGVILGVVVCVGLALDRAPLAKVGRLLLVPLGGAVAAGLTPLWWHVYQAPFQVSSVKDWIQEWQPTNVLSGQAIAALLLIAVCVLVRLRRGERASWVEIGVIALAAALTLTYARTVALAGPVIAPWAAVALEQVLPLRREAVSRREVSLTGGLAVLGLVVAALLAPSRAHTEGYPVALSAKLERLSPGSVVCNDSALGGWLTAVHPHLVPAVDARYEIYDTEHLEGWIAWMTAAPGWHAFHDGVGCDAALVAADSSIGDAILNQLGWRRSQPAEGYVLLTPPGSPAT